MTDPRYGPWTRRQGSVTGPRIDRSDPKNAKLQRLSLWGMPLLVGALGLIFFAAGLALAFLEPG